METRGFDRSAGSARGRLALRDHRIVPHRQVRPMVCILRLESALLQSRDQRENRSFRAEETHQKGFLPSYAAPDHDGFGVLFLSAAENAFRGNAAGSQTTSSPSALRLFSAVKRPANLLMESPLDGSVEFAVLIVNF